MKICQVLLLTFTSIFLRLGYFLIVNYSIKKQQKLLLSLLSIIIIIIIIMMMMIAWRVGNQTTAYLRSFRILRGAVEI